MYEKLCIKCRSLLIKKSPHFINTVGYCGTDKCERYLILVEMNPDNL